MAGSSAKYVNESAFIRAVNRRIPDSVYKLKLCLANQGGVFDSYYSGIAGDCWVEFKYIKPTPVSFFDPTRFLSDKQQRWGQARADQGRRVFAVYGTERGHLIQIDNFVTTSRIDMREDQLATTDEVARFIQELTGGPGAH